MDKINYDKTKESAEAVYRSVLKILEGLKEEIKECELVNITFLLKAGHGTDITILTDKHGLLAASEVTTSSGKNAKRLAKKNIEKLRKLSIKHRYLCLQQSVCDRLKDFLSNAQEDGIETIPL